MPDNEAAGFNFVGMYVAGCCTDKDIAKGLAIFETAGNCGDSCAWMQLGKIFAARDLESVHDPAKVAGFLLLAAHSNYAKAWYLFGQLYDEGYALPIGFSP